MRKRSRFRLSAVVATLLVATPGWAATTALYRFDSQQVVSQTTSRGTASALQWEDSTSNDWHLYRRLVEFKGEAWLVDELPPVGSSGLSLREFGGGPIMTETGGNFSVGASTGQRTIEFWYQPRELPGGGQSQLRYIMSQDDYNQRGGGGNGWSLFQEYDSTTGLFGFGTFQSNSGYTQTLEVKSPKTMALNEWYHLAATLNTVTDTIKLYIDGVLVQSQTGVTMTIGPKTNAPLLIGSDSNVLSGFGGGVEGVGAFIGSFGMDDLRFSDVELLPGNGTGVGELAWNAALPSAPQVIPGDFDSDGDVDGADFVAWQTHFPLSSGAALASGDADRDGDVDGADFVVWQTHFPFSPNAGATAVAEPSSWTLIWATGVLLALKYRSKLRRVQNAVVNNIVPAADRLPLFCRAAAFIGFCLLVMASRANAATTALYLFDELITTSQYYTYPDSSGVDSLTLRFPTSPAGRTGSLGFDGPHDPINSGTSLHVNYATPFESLVPTNGNFSVGASTEISIEFWYYAAVATSKHFILAQDDENQYGGGNGWSIIQDRPDPSGKFAIRATFTDSYYANTGGAGGNLDPGHIQILDTPIFMDTEVWYHVAVTLDADIGQAKMYIDGQEKSSATGWDLDTMTFAAKTNAPLTIGSQGTSQHGFANNFYIDELRFSNTVLLPGNGTGVDELAWNASLAPQSSGPLVPEPSGFTMACLAMALVTASRGVLLRKQPFH